jgi:transcriptional antiterminator RfaH
MNWVGSASESEGTGWYCARTQLKREHIAAANVAKRLGLEVFHPRIRLERATRRGVVRLVEPLFPCYLFVRLNLEAHLDLVRSTHGIANMVNFRGVIPVIPEQVIEDLRQAFDAEEPVPLLEALKPGMEVTVTVGPFEGACGVVARVLPAKQRIQILLDFLGRTTLAEVDKSAVVAENRSMAELIPSLCLGQGMGASIAA